MQQTIVNTHFNYGMINDTLQGRGDSDLYQKSARTIINFDVMPLGGIRRRFGTKYLATLRGKSRIIPFEYMDDRNFLLLFSNKIIDIYDATGALKVTITSPYNENDLQGINYALNGNSLYITNENHPIHKLTFYAINDKFELTKAEFNRGENGLSFAPFARFDDTIGIKLKPSETVNNIVLTASKPLFNKISEGAHIQLNSGEISITKIADPKQAEAKVIKPLSTNNETDTWYESAFSKYRGYPKTITFFDARMILGGTHSLPSRIWISKLGDYMNFDLGKAMDTDAIEFDLVSNNKEEITAIIPARHLEIFTSCGEWHIKSPVITPTAIAIEKHTSFGSNKTNNIGPILTGQSTVFIGKNKGEIRDLTYNEISGIYTSSNLSYLKPSIVYNTISACFNKQTSTMFLVQNSGHIAACLLNKDAGIIAWHEYQTDGYFTDVISMENNVYFITKRDDKYLLEILSEDGFSDSFVKYKFENPITELTGLSHLNGKTVMINADDFIHVAKVENNKITLDAASTNVTVGLPYTHIFDPLTVFINGNIIPKSTRLIKLMVRLYNSKLIQIDTGSGLKTIGNGRFDGQTSFNNAPQDYTGDITVYGKGFLRGYDIPLFMIKGTAPYPLTILNLTYKVELIR